METLSKDVIVVGGGMIGCAAALELAARGRSVVVLERGYIGAQSSGTNFGLLRRQDRYPGQLPLANRAAKMWFDLEDRLGEPVEFAPHGHLRFALTDEDMAIIERYAEEARPFGFEFDIFGRAECRERWPWLGPNVVGGGFCAEDGSANPRLVTPAIARKAQALGALMLEEQDVTEARHTGGRFIVETRQGLRCEAGVLINTAGAWAHHIASQFGETVVLNPIGPPEAVTEPVPFFMTTAIQRVGSTVVLRQVKRGNVILAGKPRGVADNVTNRAYVAPASTLANMRKALDAMPVLANLNIIRVWSGIEVATNDNLPVIGPSATTPGLFHAFGFSGHGFQIGPAVGAVLSELVVDGRTPTPIEPFAITRFTATAPAATPASH